MQTALLQYPYDSSVKLLNSLLVRRGYTVVAINNEEGTIKANIPGGLFKKPKTLNLKVHKIDRYSTKVEVWINANQTVVEKPNTDEERLEEKFINSIYHYF